MTDKMVLPDNLIYQCGKCNYLANLPICTRCGTPCPVLPYAEVRRKVLEEARDAVAKSPFLRAHRGHYIDIIDALIDDALIDGEPT